MLLRHTQQSMGGYRLVCAVDLNQLGSAEGRYVINQSHRGLAEHHATWRGRRLHPLSHADLLTDGGVTERS